MEINRLTWEWNAEPVPQNQILRRERGQRNIHVSCSADHEQDWQPYTVDPYSCYKCDHTTYTTVKTRPLCGDRLSKRMLFWNDFARFFLNDQILLREVVPKSDSLILLGRDTSYAGVLHNRCLFHQYNLFGRFSCSHFRLHGPDPRC